MPGSRDGEARWFVGMGETVLQGVLESESWKDNEVARILIDRTKLGSICTLDLKARLTGINKRQKPIVDIEAFLLLAWSVSQRLIIVPVDEKL